MNLQACISKRTLNVTPYFKSFYIFALVGRIGEIHFSWQTYLMKVFRFYPCTEIWKISLEQGIERHSSLVSHDCAPHSLDTCVECCLFAQRSSRTSVQIDEMLHTFLSVILKSVNKYSYMQYYYKQYEECLKTKELILKRCQERWLGSLVQTLDENKDIHEQVVLIFNRFAQKWGSYKKDIRECEKYVSWLFSEQYSLTSHELTQLAYRIYGSKFVYSNTSFIHGGRSVREYYNPFDKFTTSQFFPIFFFFLAGVPSLFLCMGAGHIPFENKMPLIIMMVATIAYCLGEMTHRHYWITPAIVNLICSLCNFIWWRFTLELIPLYCCVFFFISGLLALCFKKRITIAMGASGWKVGNKWGDRVLLYGEE